MINLWRWFFDVWIFTFPMSLSPDIWLLSLGDAWSVGCALWSVRQVWCLSGPHLLLSGLVLLSAGSGMLSTPATGYGQNTEPNTVCILNPRAQTERDSVLVRAEGAILLPLSLVLPILLRIFSVTGSEASSRRRCQRSAGSFVRGSLSLWVEVFLFGISWCLDLVFELALFSRTYFEGLVH